MPDDQDHARKQKQTSETCRWVSPPTSLGDLITSDHKILNLDDESRNDHWNAFIVQDGYPHWMPNHCTKTKRCGRNIIILADSPATIPKAWESIYRQFEESIEA